MNEARLDLASLRNAIASLEGAIDVVSDRAWFDVQSDKARDTLIAGVIQKL